MKLKLRKFKETGIEFKKFDGLSVTKMKQIRGGNSETPPDDPEGVEH